MLKTKGIHYHRVVMLRSDVMYLTPTDIYRRANGELDVFNEYAGVGSECVARKRAAAVDSS